MEAVGTGLVPLGEGRAILRGQFGLAAGKGVLEAGQRGTARQRSIRIGVGAGQALEQRVGAEGIRVVAVGVVGQDLVDLLAQERFAGRGDERLGAGVGQAAGEVGEIAEPLVEVADGEQAGVRDEVRGSEDDRDRLPVDGGERQVRGVRWRQKP